MSEEAIFVNQRRVIVRWLSDMDPEKARRICQSPDYLEEYCRYLQQLFYDRERDGWNPSLEVIESALRLIAETE
jgi:hypothetical protein